ncbi:MAG: phosphocholine cytidylyltransferase family protein [Desulfobacter sp.]|nr:MAG: phosphocholine cytidylyltransferase family protein [Desulfobacter sp.]
MKALILAAGLGSRLNDYTKEIPKALVKVAGKPIIDYQITSLKANGIKDIVIATGYHGGLIKKYVQKFSDCHFKFVNNPEYDNSNSSYSFWLASHLIEGEAYIHLNCDIIVNEETIQLLINCHQDNIIVMDKSIQLSDNMELVALNGDRIVEMRNTLFEGAVGKAVGVAKLSHGTVVWLKNRIFQYIENGDKCQNYYGVIRQAVKVHDIRVIEYSGILLEVNTVSDLKKAEMILLS